MNFEERALNVEDKLTDLEDDLVLFILKNKETVVQTKISALATSFYTVPNTITRFCHKLGYEGFVDLKFGLKWELMQKKKPLSKKDYLLKNMDLIDSMKEERCIKLFQDAKAVNFFAIGQTGELSKVCVDNFYALDSKFVFVPHPNTLSHKMTHTKGEIFFFISLSGESDLVVQKARLAKEKGHVIISLTHLSRNSLVEIADVNLFCFVESELVENYDVTDKTPLMIVMNSLFHRFLLSRKTCNNTRK